MVVIGFLFQYCSSSGFFMISSKVSANRRSHTTDAWRKLFLLNPKKKRKKILISYHTYIACYITCQVIKHPILAGHEEKKTNLHLVRINQNNWPNNIFSRHHCMLIFKCCLGNKFSLFSSPHIKYLITCCKTQLGSRRSQKYQPDDYFFFV
jgi:hypothetical protein